MGDSKDDKIAAAEEGAPLNASPPGEIPLDKLPPLLERQTAYYAEPFIGICLVLGITGLLVALSVRTAFHVPEAKGHGEQAIIQRVKL